MGAKMYSIDFLGNIIRDSDGAIIPVDVNNIDYHNYLTWVDEGNTPQPYEPPPVDLKAAAQEALNKCDRTALRCFKAKVEWPTEWKDYDAELRAIMNGTSSATELPTRPDYPAGS